MLWLVEFALEKLAREGERYEDALKHGDNNNLRAIGQNMTSLIPQITRTLSLYLDAVSKVKVEEDSLAEILAKIPDQESILEGLPEKEAKRVVKLFYDSKKTRVA